VTTFSPYVCIRFPGYGVAAAGRQQTGTTWRFEVIPEWKRSPGRNEDATPLTCGS
jgi:hypothetical protein